MPAPPPPINAPNNITVSATQNTAISLALGAYGENEPKKRRPRRRPRGAAPGNDALDVGNSEPRNESQPTPNNARRRNGGRQPPDGPGAEGDNSGPPGRSSPANVARGQARRGRGQEGRGRGQHPPAGGPPRGGGRRRQINATLTGAEAEGSSEAASSNYPKLEGRADTLTNRLIDALRTPPYADCPICFNSIHPAQPIWSCSPSGSHSSLQNNDPEGMSSDTQCCYTPFHLRCIKSWASKSVKDMRDAYIARGESEKQGEWRCPGCQRRRLHVPSSYLCFCGSTPDPRPARLATPHSCGNPCTRPRACNHSCSLSCHPGPCPPCQITIQLPCHCGRQIKTFRCANLTALSSNGASGRVDAPSADLSCMNVCDKILGCGKHHCVKTCHPGACDECPIVESSRCYCGKKERSLRCGEGEEKHSCISNEAGILEEWDGRFVCENACGRTFDCGIHKCEKPCHPPSTSPPSCPRSPSLITHCPCGKQHLTELKNGLREKCTDPIATCGNMCMKELEGCEHVCSVPCHTGPCPPCSISLITPCRCGSTTRAVQCHARTAADATEILCDRPCTALRACGRHQCNRVCCPLAALGGGAKGKGKKRQAQAQLSQGLEDGLGAEAHWHECDLVCGKTLGCGNHRCEERDHRGACPPCLRSSFDEMVCYCGRTVVEPPIPCGTRMSCSYPCSRPPPPCGHPKSQHMCHEDPTPCPPCPFLATKACACGKNSVMNVRCSQEKVSCGTTCGKLLDCGFHRCERSCHGGDCGTCTLTCGKPRKLCLPAHHSCTLPCHAPAACSEDGPCQATITLRCPCGRVQQDSLCGRSISNPAGREVTQQLKCTNECAVAKRNARLAEALGISQEVQEREGQRPVTYSDELIAFARANAKFCGVVEKSFSDFVSSDRKSQILPHMHEARRKFVHDLAAVYRVDTQMVDQEPKRSVQLIRRIDTRIPKPLLSSVVAPNTNLGKLADLRSLPAPAPFTRPSSASSNHIASTSQSAGTGTGRGWSSVVSSAGPALQTPASAWGTPIRAVERSAPPRNTPRAPEVEQVASRLIPLGRPTVNTNVDGRPEDGNVPDDWENDEV